MNHEIGPRHDSKPDQPKDSGAMTQKEIDAVRQEIMESVQFKDEFLDFIINEMTPDQAGTIANRIDSGDYFMTGLCIKVMFREGIEKIIQRIQEAK